MNARNVTPLVVSNPTSLPQLSLSDKSKAVARSTAMRVIDVCFWSKVAVLHACGIVDFSVPPNHAIRRTSSRTIRHYFESGLTTLLPITTAALLNGVDLDGHAKVLDFGCGVGRQLLQMTRKFPDALVSACDANPDNIKYIQNAFPQANAYANNFDPPLNYADGTFDLVYSVSTFSHFSLEDARLWLTELRRVTKPGGILCLTFNSYTSLGIVHRSGKHLDYTTERLDMDRYWYDVDEGVWHKRKAEEAVSPFGSKTAGATRPTGNMYFSPAGAKEFFESGGLRLVGHAPGVIDHFQDLAVLRKPLM